MKASELIIKLQEMIDKHGDLKTTQASFDDEEIREIHAYDDDGNTKGIMVEFHLT